MSLLQFPDEWPDGPQGRRLFDPVKELCKQPAPHLVGHHEVLPPGARAPSTIFVALLHFDDFAWLISGSNQIRLRRNM